MPLQDQVFLNQQREYLTSLRKPWDTGVPERALCTLASVLLSRWPCGHFACWSHISLCRRAKILFSLVRVSDGVLLDGYVWHSGMLECGLGILWDSQGLSAPETDKKSYSGVKSWAYDDKLMQKVLVDWIRAYDLGPRPTWGSCFGFYHPGIKNYNSKVPLPTFSRSTQGNTF